MEILLVKSPTGTLMPSDEKAAEFIAKKKPWVVLRADVKEMRNYKFHQKWFCLAMLAFNIWSETIPQREYKGVKVEPDFERFRKDLVILCGMYQPVFNIRGELRLEAESLSFANMSQEVFETLYSKTIDVILKSILGNSGKDEAWIRNEVDRVMSYT